MGRFNRSGHNANGDRPFNSEDFNIRRERTILANQRALNAPIVAKANGAAVTSYWNLYPTYMGTVKTPAQKPGIIGEPRFPESTGLDELQSSLTNY